MDSEATRDAAMLAALQKEERKILKVLTALTRYEGRLAIIQQAIAAYGGTPFTTEPPPKRSALLMTRPQRGATPTMSQIVAFMRDHASKHGNVSWRYTKLADVCGVDSQLLFAAVKESVQFIVSKKGGYVKLSTHAFPTQ